MESIEERADILTATQREILSTLVGLYEQYRRPIKGKEIAEVIKKDEGTVRNLAPSLKSLKLITAIPGPKGGFIPTPKAYEILSIPVPEEKVGKIYIYKGIERLPISVSGLEFRDVEFSEPAKVFVKIVGDLSGIEIGDIIRIGPITKNYLIIGGKVLGRDDIHNAILLSLLFVVSIPQVKIKDIMSKRSIVIGDSSPIKEAAEILIKHRIRGAPVVDKNGNVVGVVSCFDITKALAEGNYDAKASDIMSSPAIKVHENILLPEALSIMQDKDISRLVVVDNQGKLCGILTRTDILKFMLYPEIVEVREEVESVY